METNIITSYSIDKLSNDKYALSIKGNMQWVGGFIFFMLFLTLLTFAFFIPMGFSFKEYLKIVIPLLIIFIGIAVLSAYFFKRVGNKVFIFDVKNQ